LLAPTWNDALSGGDVIVFLSQARSQIAEVANVFHFIAHNPAVGETYNKYFHRSGKSPGFIQIVTCVLIPENRRKLAFKSVGHVVNRHLKWHSARRNRFIFRKISSGSL